MEKIILKHKKDLPGFCRKCYLGSDGKHYAYQQVSTHEWRWFLTSKDWEPSHILEDINFTMSK